MRQADRVTDRQNDSMTVWQNSRAAKEPALVFFGDILSGVDSILFLRFLFLSKVS